MIQSIIGLMNSGKTLYMTKKGYEAYKEGYKVLTNYRLNFPHYYVNKDFIIWLATQNRELNRICFLFDEFWLWLGDSRSSMSMENQISTWFFNQSSKGLTKIYLSAQRNSQNEIRVRQNQHLLTICSRRLLDNNKLYKISDEVRELPEEMQPNLFIKAETYTQSLSAFGEIYQLKRKEYLRASDYFMLYNTREKKINTRLNIKVENNGLNQYINNAT